jgi:hypothetical protein
MVHVGVHGGEIASVGCLVAEEGGVSFNMLNDLFGAACDPAPSSTVLGVESFILLAEGVYHTEEGFAEHL